MSANENINDVPMEAALENKTTPQIPYYVMPTSQRRWTTLIIGLATMFLPLRANIYLPCIPWLQCDMHTSLELVNLRVTTYIIFRGITPVFFGELPDKVGRRLVYIVIFGNYVAANIGLALQDRYIALPLLRMLQGVGVSATVAIGYGVVADITTPPERGRVLGPSIVSKSYTS